MRNVIVGAALVALCGTVPETPASRLEAGVSAVSLQTCRRVEGHDLGSLPLEVELGGRTIRFVEWTTADELSTQWVGFAAQLPVGVTFTVQAGDRTFASDSPRWLHPEGVSGPRVHGIDALTFCTQAHQPTLAQR